MWWLNVYLRLNPCEADIDLVAELECTSLARGFHWHPVSFLEQCSFKYCSRTGGLREMGTWWLWILMSHRAGLSPTRSHPYISLFHVIVFSFEDYYYCQIYGIGKSMNQVLNVYDLYRAPQRFCLSCYLLNLKRSEHLYGISLVTFHNSVLVALHKRTCKCLACLSGPDFWPHSRS